MSTMLIRERYKVVRVLYTEPDYAFVEAVDIQERETPTRLLNLYEEELLHRYGKLCAGIRWEDCPAFQGMFLNGETLVTVFTPCAGTEIDQVFYRGDRWSWQDRLHYAGLLLHRALELTNLPPELSCAAMLSENVLVDTNKKDVRLRYMVRPMEGMTPRELALLAGDQVKKILPRQSTTLEAQLDFLEELDRGTFGSIVGLYACWREAEEKIRAEREAFAKKNFIGRGLALLRLRLKRLRKQRIRR